MKRILPLIIITALAFAAPIVAETLSIELRGTKELEAALAQLASELEGVRANHNTLAAKVSLQDTKISALETTAGGLASRLAQLEAGGLPVDVEDRLAAVENRDEVKIVKFMGTRAADGTWSEAQITIIDSDGSVTTQPVVIPADTTTP